MDWDNLEIEMGEYDEPAIFYALYDNNQDFLNRLLEADFDPDYFLYNEIGNALTVAFTTTNARSVLALLKHGAEYDVEFPDDEKSIEEMYESWINL